MSNDMVNHPSHYEGGTSMECIDSMLAVLGHDGLISFCIGNAYKYIWRHQLKGKPLEDLQKAEWYINKASRMDYGDYHDRIVGLRDLYAIHMNKLADDQEKEVEV